MEQGRLSSCRGPDTTPFQPFWPHPVSWSHGGFPCGPRARDQGHILLKFGRNFSTGFLVWEKERSSRQLHGMISNPGGASHSLSPSWRGRWAPDEAFPESWDSPQEDCRVSVFSARETNESKTECVNVQPFIKNHWALPWLTSAEARR